MKLSEQVIEWTRKWFEDNGRKTAVLGISGGKDSAVVAAILAKAIGPENVIGVLMPNGVQHDMDDSYRVVKELGIKHTVVNIYGAYRAITRDIVGGVSEAAAINIAPRVRMTVLYAIAQTAEKGCVVGTGNKAEAYVGYTTKWGDSACDMNPIKDLWVHEVIQVGDELGFFPDIVHKVPSDGLCGKTDEESLGFSYDDVAAFVAGTRMVPENIQKAIMLRHKGAIHKIKPIPYFEKG